MRLALAVAFLLLFNGGDARADQIQRLLMGETPLQYGNGKTAEYVPVSFMRLYKDRTITVHGGLFLPPGDQPVPVMILAHGSGGLHDREFIYAREFLDMGVGALVLDFFTPRGISSTFTDQKLVPLGPLVEDVLKSFVSISTLPRVDASHVGLIGFSKGGAVAVNAARAHWYDMPAFKGIRFALDIILYPGCGIQPYPSTTTGTPMYMLLGEKDTYTGVEKCTLWADKFKAAGASISVKIYPGAAHAWDTADSLGDLPTGENLLRCLFEQQPDGTWKESSSGALMKNLSGEKYHRALDACRTYGVSERYDAALAAETMEDVKTMVRQNLLPPPMAP
ncbi:MAG: dienelactone hydrolase family protein [Proteobacteria bacterium]|nr:dienelactone hydrolase family protein [Pseudomonadota bacterium]